MAGFQPVQVGADRLGPFQVQHERDCPVRHAAPDVGRGAAQPDVLRQLRRQAVGAGDHRIGLPPRVPEAGRLWHDDVVAGFGEGETGVRVVGRHEAGEQPASEASLAGKGKIELPLAASLLETGNRVRAGSGQTKQGVVMAVEDRNAWRHELLLRWGSVN